MTLIKSGCKYILQISEIYNYLNYKVYNIKCLRKLYFSYNKTNLMISMVHNNLCYRNLYVFKL